MNLDKLITISIAVVFALSASMNLDKVQTLIWRAQAMLIYESRTETWGSPRFFPPNGKTKATKTNEAKLNPGK